MVFQIPFFDIDTDDEEMLVDSIERVSCNISRFLNNTQILISRQ